MSWPKYLDRLWPVHKRILSRNAAGWHHLLDLIQAQLGEEVPTRSPDEQQALQQHYAELVQ